MCGGRLRRDCARRQLPKHKKLHARHESRRTTAQIFLLRWHSINGRSVPNVMPVRFVPAIHISSFAKALCASLEAAILCQWIGDTP